MTDFRSPYTVCYFGAGATGIIYGRVGSSYLLQLLIGLSSRLLKPRSKLISFLCYCRSAKRAHVCIIWLLNTTFLQRLPSIILVFQSPDWRNRVKDSLLNSFVVRRLLHTQQRSYIFMVSLPLVEALQGAGWFWGILWDRQTDKHLFFLYIHGAVRRDSILTFRRPIKSRLPFAGIIRRLPYSTRFQDKG